MSEPLPVEVRQLIAGPVESMEHTELLLLLARTEPKEWTAAEAATELRVSEEETARRLGELASGGLLMRRDDVGAVASRFSFAPSLPGRRRNVELLRQTYEAKPATLVRAFFSGARSVVRDSF